MFPIVYRRGWRVVALTLSMALAVAGCSEANEQEALPSTSQSVTEEVAVPSPFCDGENGQTDLETISVGNAGGALTEAYIAWGMQEGCFAKHGLVVESVPAGGVDKIAGLVGGSLDVAAENILTLALTRGNSEVDLRVLAGHSEATAEMIEQARETPSLVDGKLLLEHVLVASPEWPVESLADIKGARVGASSGVSSPKLGLLRAIAEVGLGPEDIELVPLGSKDTFEALRAKQVDLAILSGIYAYQALDEGGQFVLYPGAYFFEPGIRVAWLTTGDIAEVKRDELLAFKSAMQDIYGLLDQAEAQASFLALLESDFGFDSDALDLFAFPPLMTRDVTSQELQYLARELWIEGLIDQEITLDDSALVK